MNGNIDAGNMRRYDNLFSEDQTSYDDGDSEE